MSKLKIILIFVALLTIPSYFILKSKNLNFRNFSNFKIKFKPESPLEEKINAANNGEIIITEEELNAIFNPYIKTLKNFHIDITAKNITANGETTIPTNSTFELIIVPEIKDGKLTYRVEQMNLGKVKAPAAFSNMIMSEVNKRLDKDINERVVVKNVTLEEGKVVLAVDKK